MTAIRIIDRAEYEGKRKKDEENEEESFHLPTYVGTYLHIHQMKYHYLHVTWSISWGSSPGLLQLSSRSVLILQVMP